MIALTGADDFVERVLQNYRNVVRYEAREEATSDRWQQNFVEHAMQAYYRQVGRPERYSSSCGAGSEGNNGFQPGNTCAGGGSGLEEEIGSSFLAEDKESGLNPWLEFVQQAADEATYYEGTEYHDIPDFTEQERIGFRANLSANIRDHVEEWASATEPSGDNEQEMEEHEKRVAEAEKLDFDAMAEKIANYWEGQYSAAEKSLLGTVGDWAGKFKDALNEYVAYAFHEEGTSEPAQMRKQLKGDDVTFDDFKQYLKRPADFDKHEWEALDIGPTDKLVAAIWDYYESSGALAKQLKRIERGQYKMKGRPERYSSSCGAGDEGSPGFQAGNTCGGEGGEKESLPFESPGLNAGIPEGDSEYYKKWVAQAESKFQEAFERGGLKEATEEYNSQVALGIVDEVSKQISERMQDVGFIRTPEWWANKIEEAQGAGWEDLIKENYFDTSESDVQEIFEAHEGLDYEDMAMTASDEIGNVMDDVISDSEDYAKEIANEMMDDETYVSITTAPNEWFSENVTPEKVMGLAADFTKFADSKDPQAGQALNDHAYNIATDMGREALMEAIEEAIDEAPFSFDQEQREEITEHVMEEFADNLDSHWNEDALYVGDSLNPYAAAGMIGLAVKGALSDMDETSSAFDKINEIASDSFDAFSLERSFQAVKYALAKSGHFRLDGDVTKYASSCGAGSEGKKPTNAKVSLADDRAFHAIKYALARSNYFRLDATRQTHQIATIQA